VELIIPNKPHRRSREQSGGSAAPTHQPDVRRSTYKQSNRDAILYWPTSLAFICSDKINAVNRSEQPDGFVIAPTLPNLAAINPRLSDD
jgi:hypothetical protein